MKEQRNRTRVDGDGASQLVQLIRKFGYNQDVNFELGTVTAAPPALKIKLDGVESFELDANDLIVAEYLTKHTRTITLTGGGPNEGEVEGNMTDYTHSHTVSNYTHSHSGDSGGSTGIDTHSHTLSTDTHAHVVTDIVIGGGKITFDNELAVGDRVILASYNDSQSYIVLDRAVRYNGA